MLTNEERNNILKNLTKFKGQGKTVKISYLFNLNDATEETIAGNIVYIEDGELKLDNKGTIIRLDSITKVEPAESGGIRRRNTRSYRRKMRSSRSRRNRRRSYRRRG